MKLILNIINEFEKIYTFSASLHQDFHRNVFKCFSKYLPRNIIPNIVSEEDIDLVIDEVVTHREKSDT